MARWKKRVLCVLLVMGFVLGVYASCVEPFLLRTTMVSLTSEKWRDEPPLRVVLLADMHVIWPWMTPAHLTEIVAEANALKPDLVLLLGDYVATHPWGVQVVPEEGIAPLLELKAQCGVYGVLGNHDVHPDRGWPAALERSGISVLNNKAVRLSCDGRDFWVAGIEELWWKNADLDATLRQVTDDRPVLLMMHHPDSFPDVPQRVALSVAGHTHGGQVRLPFIGPLGFVVPSKYGTRYAYGHIVEEGKDLFVSSGLGMTGLPIRFLTPPEIAVIDVQGAP